MKGAIVAASPRVHIHLGNALLALHDWPGALIEYRRAFVVAIRGCR